MPPSTPEAFQEREKEGRVGAIYKQSYCLGDSTECARYRVAKALGREKVPQNLFPNMLERAAALVAGEA